MAFVIDKRCLFPASNPSHGIWPGADIPQLTAQGKPGASVLAHVSPLVQTADFTSMQMIDMIHYHLI